jgi:hypothetical protein
MARQHPAQVVGFGRADPVHDMAAGSEEHRDRQPGRSVPPPPQAACPRGSRPARLVPPAPRLATVGIALRRQTRLAVAGQHPDGMGTGDRKGRSRPAVGPPSCCLLGRGGLLAAASPGRRWVTATVPRALHPTTAPTHVLQLGPDPAGSGHFPHPGHPGHPGHPWPAKGGNQTNEAQRTSAFLRGPRNATPGTSRDAHATLEPWCASSTAVPR